MMNIRSLSIAALVGMLGFAEAQAQDTITKINDLPEFNEIDIKGALSVYLTQGDKNVIKIVSSDKEDETEYQITNNLLSVKGKGFSHSKTKVYITAKMIQSLQVHGATTLLGNGKIQGENLKVTSSGASDVELNVDMKQVNIESSGASDIEISGVAQKATMEASGSSDIKAIDFAVDSAIVTVSGASDAKVNAKKYLSIHASGSSDVTYLGNPEKIEKELSGASGVKGNVDTAHINILGNKKMIIIGDDEIANDIENSDSLKTKKKKNTKIYWAGVGLGVNGYLNKNMNTTVPAGSEYLELNYAKSTVFTLNFFETKLPIVRNHINLVSGLGFEFNNYRFENDYTLWADTSLIGATFDSTKSFSKNKLLVTYLQAPLLLQFNTKPLNKSGNKSLHISLGVVGGWRIGTHTKQIREKGDNSDKVKDDFNIAAFKYGPMVRIGYGNLDLWASYSTNNMFRSNQSPDLNQFSVGLTLVGF